MLYCRQNDVGKSTILKALDAFLNDHAPSFEDKNIYNDYTIIEMKNHVRITGRFFDPLKMADVIIMNGIKNVIRIK